MLDTDALRPYNSIRGMIMDEKSEIKHVCETCLFFIKFYIKIGRTFFVADGRGECTKWDLSYEEWRDTVHEKKICGNWQWNPQLNKSD